MGPHGKAWAVILGGALVLCSAGACSKPFEKENTGADAARDGWPQFRGPTGMGIVPAAGDFPLDWSPTTGRNILWKLDVAAFGHSSPIVWAGKLFLTGESGGKGRIVCVACADGAVLWDIPVVSATPEQTSVAMGGGLCAPTPATDGRRVYALFSTGDVVCASLGGEVLWSRHLCDPVNSFGLSSSPVLWKGSVIVQLDQGNAEDDGLSVVMALEKDTGKTLWSTKRPVPNSWSTPVVIQHEGRHQLITCANPFVIAYDPDTGTELWRVEGLGGEVVPMAAYADGRVFAANADSKVLAIIPGGTGDVTDTRVAWSGEDGLPSMASPVTDGRRLLLCATGELTCYNARTGDIAWRETAGENFCASPALVGGRVYLPDQTGKMLIFELGDRYELISSPDIQDEITASPAFSRGRIYLRTKRSLFCIGKR